MILYPSLQKTFVNYAGSRRLKHCLEFSYLKQRKLRNTVYKCVICNYYIIILIIIIIIFVWYFSRGICVIVRELNLNLEETFLCSLFNLIPKRPETKHSIAAKLRRDVSNVRVPSVQKMNNVIISYHTQTNLIYVLVLIDTRDVHCRTRIRRKTW